MLSSGWLDSFRRRLAARRPLNKRKTSQRLPNTFQLAASELLETRALLSSSAIFLGGELQIQTDANESVTVQVDPTNTSRMQVLINNLPATGVPTLLTSQLTSLVITTGDSDNTVNLSGVTQASFANLTNIEINTGNGNDNIIGSSDLPDIIDAGNGNDTINGLAGNDTILAGDGNDSILAGLGNDSVNAGDGADFVQGDLGNDTIDAGDGADSVTGDAGDDSIIGGDGADSVSGNTGNDFVVGNGGADNITGDDGDDTVFGGAGADTITGDLGNDWLKGNGSSDSMTGGDGNDSLEGDAGDDSITGDVGNDTIIGGLGNDRQVGGQDDDLIFGGAGNDLILADGVDATAQEFGNDTATGNAGNDTIVGGRGADTLDGSAGNDFVASTFTVETLPPPPPPPVPPVPPPPTPTGGASIQVLNPAVATGVGGNIGTSGTLSFGSGDGSLQITNVDAAGTFFTSTFDPLGPTYPSGDPLFFAEFELRVGSGNQQTLSANTQLAGNTSELRSTFSQSNLDFGLVQTVGPLDNATGTRIGALLTQTFTITNPGAQAVTFDITRYTDYHMFLYPNSNNDGGGLLLDPNGVQVFFESTNTIVPGSSNAFVGISGEGGTPTPNDRYWLADLGTVDQTQYPLPNVIAGDTDGDGIVDVPTTDNRIALRNYFTLAPGASTTYTAHTAFGTVIAIPINVAPTGQADSATTFANVPVTFDVVSNDSDSDGALDYTTIQVATPPSNGTAVSLGNGLMTYTPATDFAGTDTFTYTIADNNGARSAPITVTITVNQGNDNVGDLLLGGTEDDTLVGGIANDTLNGQAGNDSLTGGAGDDLEYGGAGDDIVHGESGDDTLVGNAGSDTLDGQAGDDTLIWRGALDGSDSFTSSDGFDSAVVQGTSGFDTMLVAGSGSNLVVTFGSAVLTVDPTIRDVTISGGSGGDTITVNDISTVGLSALTVNGDDGDDFINATNANNSSVVLFLNGGIGNDGIRGGEGIDRIDGGDGNDNILARGGNDVINGGLGDDAIDAGDGNDTFDGGDGSDTISGGNGNDVGTGGLGNDSIVGDAGNDSISGGIGDDSLNGATGDDSVLGDLGSDYVQGGAGNDTVDGGRNNDTVSGNSGDDVLRGDHGDDVLNGGVGNDTINAGDGNDSVYGGDGNDLISGGDGNDYVLGQLGRDTIVGGDGNDTLNGGGSNDILLGQQGDDILKGAGGTDIGSGGQGANNDLTAASASIEVIDETFILSSDLLTALAK